MIFKLLILTLKTEKSRKKQKVAEKRSKKIKIDQKSYHKVFSSVQKKAKIRNLRRSK